MLCKLHADGYCQFEKMGCLILKDAKLGLNAAIAVPEWQNFLSFISLLTEYMWILYRWLEKGTFKDITTLVYQCPGINILHQFL